MKKLFFAAGGIAVIAFVLAVSFYFINRGDIKIAKLGGFKVTSVAPNAFGLLSQVSSPAEQGIARTQGGGGGGVGLGSSAPQIADSNTSVSSEGARADSAKMIAPMPPYYNNNYKYVYVGEDIKVPESQMAVLKRVMGNNLGKQFASIAKKLDLGLLDLSGFSDASIQSINLAEDKDFGYIVNIDLVNEQIYISENWNKWKNSMNDCRDQDCYESLRLKSEDVPANEELVKIADEFLQKLNVDQGIYGAGEVEDDFRIYYLKSSSPENIYIPESITIVYPLMINGEKVYEEGGGKNGLRVNVNVREKRVAGIYGLVSQNYESSMYDVITDVEKIKNMVEQGGMYPQYYYNEDATTKEVKVGSPTISYVKMWKYNGSIGEELLVPAFIFPIENFSELENFYQRNLIIPLVKEIIDERTNQVEPPIRILDSITEPVIGPETGASPSEVIPMIKGNIGDN